MEHFGSLSKCGQKRWISFAQDTSDAQGKRFHTHLYLGQRACSHPTSPRLILKQIPNCFRVATLRRRRRRMALQKLSPIRRSFLEHCSLSIETGRSPVFTGRCHPTLETSSKNFAVPRFLLRRFANNYVVGDLLSASVRRTNTQPYSGRKCMHILFCNPAMSFDDRGRKRVSEASHLGKGKIQFKIGAENFWRPEEEASKRNLTAACEPPTVETVWRSRAKIDQRTGIPS
jgi:hypothetical protein